MVLKALLIGKVREFGDKNSRKKLGKAWQSAIMKNAVASTVRCEKLGFVGDAVADTAHHGGAEKAVFANSLQNYGAWEYFLGLKNLPFGAMGENLTIDGLDENSVCVGDLHQIGSVILQVSQPRKPCFKLSLRWSNAELTKEIFRSGRTGWYYRVVQEGSCKAGDEIKIIEKDPLEISVMMINKAFYEPKQNLELIEKIALLRALGGTWQDDFRARLADAYNLDYMEI